MKLLHNISRWFQFQIHIVSEHKFRGMCCLSACFILFDCLYHKFVKCWRKCFTEKSYKEVDKNKAVGMKKLMHFKRSAMLRGAVFLLETSLADNNEMPLKYGIVWYFKYLAQSMESSKKRLAEFVNEKKILWTGKLNFPLMLEQTVHTKLEKVTKTYNEYTRQGKYEVCTCTEWKFWCTKNWWGMDECRWQGLACTICIGKYGQVVYSTGHVASKRRKLHVFPSTATSETTTMDSLMENLYNTDSQSDDSDIGGVNTFEGS